MTFEPRYPETAGGVAFSSQYSIMMAAHHRLLVRNAAQIVTVCSNREERLVGEAMKNISILNADAEGLSVAVGGDGNIISLGPDAQVRAELQGCTFDRVLDAEGKSVIPGLVDAHTHPVWVGDRVQEFAMKLAGATYMDIHAQGGGIHYTVECVRQATPTELYSSLRQRLESMLSCGTTTLEAKSGYGLTLEPELKMLQVLERAKRELPLTISSTYCGAHAVPRGSTTEAAAQDVICQQIPALQQYCEEGRLTIDNIDVFYEKGVFDADTSRRILRAGQEAGWKVNFHGDELHPMNSGKLAAELGAQAVSHLERVSQADISAMAEAGVIGILLPTTAYLLRLQPPPARALIDMGVAVALGSDFNPNAYCLSMPMVMHLACVLLHMSMPEALAASTINAAASLGLSSQRGSIEVGKAGDLVVVNANRWEHLVYQFGCHDNTIKYVIKEGKVLVEK